jgi:hypothetical protein
VGRGRKEGRWVSGKNGRDLTSWSNHNAAYPTAMPGRMDDGVVKVVMVDVHGMEIRREMQMATLGAQVERR